MNADESDILVSFIKIYEKKISTVKEAELNSVLYIVDALFWGFFV